MPFAEKYRRFY